MISVVTTFSAEGYETYGRKMIQKFLEHWPRDVHIHVYYEHIEPYIKNNRVVYHKLFDEAPELMAFLMSAEDDTSKGYNGAARRFAPKSYTICAAGQSLSGKMIWLDADTLTHCDIPHTFLSTLLGRSFSAYLGRDNYHSEGGFYMFDLEHEYAKPFFQRWQAYYDKGTIFNLKYWHDCGVYDAIRELYPADGFRNLTPEAAGMDHCFINGPLGAYMDHLKGPRKAAGKSFQTDLKVARSEAYWR